MLKTENYALSVGVVLRDGNVASEGDVLYVSVYAASFMEDMLAAVQEREA